MVIANHVFLNESVFITILERMYKKVLPLIATTLFTAGSLALTSVCSAQTLKKAADSNTFTVSYRKAAVPFSYVIAPNKAVGFAMDIADAITEDVKKKLGKPNLQIAYISVTAQNRIPLLVNGTYDLECGSTTNNSARGKEVTFGISHFFTGTRLLTRKSSGIKNYADLAGKAVVTTAGSTNEKVMRKYSAENKIKFQINLGKGYDDSFQQVEDGSARAFAMDDILLFGLRANSKDPAAYEVVGDTLQVEPYGCMLRKDGPEFKELVDRTITRLMTSGEFTRLYAKWFESPIPPKGVALNMPMSDQLKANLKALSDQPAL